MLPASARGDGLAWQFYKDGLRRLTLLPGVETDEIVRFLEVVNRARLLATDAGDDLLTLLWEQEFVLISYAFIEAQARLVHEDEFTRQPDLDPTLKREHRDRAAHQLVEGSLDRGVLQRVEAKGP